jgi:hypothetical protein
VLDLIIESNKVLLLYKHCKETNVSVIVVKNNKGDCSTGHIEECYS